MSIVLVGGHDRMHDEYKQICCKRGHRVKIYTQMPARFDKVIGTPDGIVLFTGTVSHKMILTALREAKKKKISVFRSHTSSANSLEELLAKMEGTDGVVCPS